MHLHRLSAKNQAELLAFELKNKPWFEEYIGARPPAFYSAEGIAKHVQELTQAFRRGEAYPGIIEREGRIVGRVNIRKLKGTNFMRLGYRVGLHSTGQGIASFGVAEVLRRICLFPNVSSVIALVSVENPASQRVLEKNGFRAVRKHANYANVGGQLLDCWEYRFRVPS